MGLPQWLSRYRICPQCRRHMRCRFDLWVGKIPWKRNGNPLQYSCLESPKDRGAWQAIVHGGYKESDMTEGLSMHACIHECPGPTA